MRLGWLLLLSTVLVACSANLASGSDTPATRFIMKQAVEVPPFEAQLSSLQSFQAEVTVNFNGQRGGEVAAGVVETKRVVDRPAEQLYRSTYLEGKLPNARTPLGLTEFYQVADRVYLNLGDESIWFEPLLNAPLAPETLGLLDLTPWLVLPSVSATAPLSQTLNGLETNYYTFTQADLTSPQVAFDQAAGEMWVLQPQNIVVSYELSATVRILNPMPNAALIDTGTIRVSYRLSQINQPVTIKPPFKARSSPLLALPRPADAELTAVYPSLIEYTSASSPYSTTIFLRDRLMTLGWTPVLTNVFEEKAQLGFTKGDQTATILVNPNEANNGATVVLDLGGN
ncbi:MAG TPA: hypothetical protein PKE64_10255 [Anaerolineae bacterium]|nr:hypothetical protein [Anaerolineae bacterium]